MKEKHPNTTLFHSNNSVELCVSSPPQRSIEPISSQSIIPKMRLFKLRRSRSLHLEKPVQSNVVITPKINRRPSLQITIPMNRSQSDTDIPLAIPITSTRSSSSDETFAAGRSLAGNTLGEASVEDYVRETYFLKTDFAKNTWMETVTSQSTESLSLGFFSIMAATVVIHPILFVTGAATAVWAVGVVHAVEKGYEFFSDGQFKNMFWADSDVEQFEWEKRSIGNATKGEPVQALNTPAKMPVLEYSAEKDVGLPPISPTSPLASPHPSKSSRRHLTPMDAAIMAHYPQLDTAVVTAEFPGLNALEFFHVFLSDKAPYSFKEFQQTRGDVDIEFGKWKRDDSAPFSFHPKAASDLAGKPPLPSCSRKERVLNFKTLTKSYFGPAYAAAKKTQRVSKFSTRLVIVESKTELSGIPYCDRFFVLEKWIIESSKHDNSIDPSMLYTTKLSVSVEVFMIKKCSWETQIRQKTLDTVTDLVTCWTEKATQALQLTLQRKLERMRKINDSQDTRSLYSFRSKESKASRATISVSPNLKRHKKDQKVVPGKSEQTLMDLHQKNLKELERKIANGDLEWCSIEIQHCIEAGEGKAFAEVLNPQPNGNFSDINLQDKLRGMDINENVALDDDFPLEISIHTKPKKKKKRSKSKCRILRSKKH